MDTVIILILLLLVVAIPVIISLRLSKSTAQRSSSPAPATGNPTATPSASKGVGRSGLGMPSWIAASLLILSLLWLILRILILKGMPGDWESTFAVIAVLAGAMLLKKEQRFVGFMLSGIIIFMVLFPGVITWVQGLRDGEMSPIVINRDGEYELPNRPLKVCFIKTGMPDRDFYMYQQIIIDSWSTPDKILEGCIDIPQYLSGKKVNISLGSAGKIYTPAIRARYNIQDDEIYNDYTYNFKNGIGNYPTIQAR